jgi:hypothetical protein|tara:strand:+ start:239 stop:505 length:267 start_codon:yes stop_codon:yes gene_type:complete
MTSKFADQVFPVTKRGGKTVRNLYNKIFAVISNSAGFVTLDAITSLSGAGSKASVSTRLSEMEAILGRTFKTVSVNTGNGNRTTAYSL